MLDARPAQLSFECDQHRVWHFDDPQPGAQLPSGMVALASSTSGLRGVPNAACGNESSRVALHSMVSTFSQCHDRVLLPFESHRLMADPYCYKPVRIWLAPAVRTTVTILCSPNSGRHVRHDALELDSLLRAVRRYTRLPSDCLLLVTGTRIHDVWAFVPKDWGISRIPTGCMTFLMLR